MKKINDSSSISDILIDLGIKKGDVLYLTVDMSKIPLPKIEVDFSRDSYKKRQYEWCEYLYSQINTVIGENGTLIVHSFSYSYIHGEIFDLKKTNSEVGPFTEYIRQKSNSIRSLHPVFSLSGVGKYAPEILSNCGRSGFGMSSPFFNLSKFNAIFVSLGTTIGESMTYLHHLEQMHGVTHRFNQCFDYKVVSEDAVVSGPWIANLRYLNTKSEPNLIKAENELINAGVVSTISDEIYQSVKISDVDIVVSNMLSANPAILSDPPISIRINDKELTYSVF
jgi:aminoglycoside 3-N-acetyltransferase